MIGFERRNYTRRVANGDRSTWRPRPGETHYLLVVIAEMWGIYESPKGLGIVKCIIKWTRHKSQTTKVGIPISVVIWTMASKSVRSWSRFVLTVMLQLGRQTPWVDLGAQNETAHCYLYPFQKIFLICKFSFLLFICGILNSSCNFRFFKSHQKP